jgi:hypothetical protein
MRHAMGPRYGNDVHAVNPADSGLRLGLNVVHPH